MKKDNFTYIIPDDGTVEIFNCGHREMPKRTDTSPDIYERGFPHVSFTPSESIPVIDFKEQLYKLLADMEHPMDTEAENSFGIFSILDDIPEKNP